jgi:hypothetical protein
VMAEDERELSAAIIEATVDEYTREGDRMVLVKRLRRNAE